jgi:hypothetical protein
MATIYLSGQGLVGVGVVDARGGDLEQLLAVAGDRVGQVDDVEDFGSPNSVICTARMQGPLGEGTDAAVRGRPAVFGCGRGGCVDSTGISVVRETVGHRRGAHRDPCGHAAVNRAR